MNEETAEVVFSLLKLRTLEAQKESVSIYKARNDYRKNFLQTVFDICRYPSTDTIENISILLHLPFRKIQVWFQNMRNNKRVKKVSPWMEKIVNNKEFMGQYDLHCIWSILRSIKSEKRDISSKHLLVLYLFFSETGKRGI